jgi:hypothetical protein
VQRAWSKGRATDGKTIRINEARRHASSPLRIFE